VLRLAGADERTRPVPWGSAAGSPGEDLLTVLNHPHVRHVVVLGRPGAGKSTTALLFVAAATAPDHAAAVPVPLSIAAWDPAAGGLESWVVRQIAEQYPQVSATEAEHLVERRLIVPVLDGLDELPVRSRELALHELETSAGAGLRAVLTSRTDEFREIVERQGVLPQAIVVDMEPVSVPDAATYLGEREPTDSTRWSGLTGRMAEQPTGPVAAALATPLMISMARQAYRDPGTSPSDLLTLPTEEQIRSRVLSRFLPSVYGSEPAAARAGRWLSLLSRRLPAQPGDPNLHWWRLARLVPRPVLVLLAALQLAVLCAVPGALLTLLEDPREALLGAAQTGVVGLFLGTVVGVGMVRTVWSPDRPQRHPLVRAARTVLAEAFTVAAVLSAALLTLLLVVARYEPDAAARLAGVLADAVRRPDLAMVTSDDPYSIVVPYLVIIVALLVFVRAVTAGQGGAPRRIVPRLRRLPASLVLGLAVGLAIAVPSIAAFFAGDAVEVAVMAPVVAGLAAALAVPIGIGRWLSGSANRLEEAVSPASVLRRDLMASVVAALGTGLSVAAAITLLLSLDGELVLGLFLAAAVGVGVTLLAFLSASSAWWAYATACGWLWLTRRLPLRLMRFLRSAQRLGVLRQAGAAYQIRHDLLRRHLDGYADAPGPARPPRVRAFLSRHALTLSGLASIAALAVTVAGLDSR
ncbi:hypothetical protein, partial [Catellatospora methionotrophica]|uniref:hypothetical protein n=1 Tax=Catellatospora methionotrophica TaxID=121620 RepID=UPI00340663C2